MKFIDASEYEELVKTGECIRNLLRSLATWHEREVVILRMYMEKGIVRFCFSVDGVKYLITANLTLQMGEKTHWTIQSNKWATGAEPIDSSSLANGHFIRNTDHK